MANRKISALPDGVPAENADIIPAVRAGSNVRVTAESIADLATGGGGGGDPWANYGTPTWRNDFNSTADFSAYTFITGSTSDLLFRSSGGVYAPTSALAALRSIPNAPFILDVRWRIARPTTGAGGEVGIFIEGDAASGRQTGFGLSTQGSANGTAQFRLNRRLNNANQSNVFAVDFGGAPWPIYADGITFRIYYDGTTYNFFTSYGNPKSVDQVAAGCIDAKSNWLGNPVRGGIWASTTNNNMVCEFAQFQDTNLDKWAGE
jgi:hypothetical protein